MSTALSLVPEETEKRPELVLPVPTAAIKARHAALEDIMRSVMRKGTDYDEIIKGQKPSLLKSGAETLTACFRLSPEVETVERFDPLIEQDVEGFEWEGPKNNRRRVPRLTKKKGFYEVVAVCTLRSADGEALGRLSGSCNNLEAKYLGQGVYECKNTIRKMAEKRAIVACVLAVTGASRIFTQDLEDDPNRFRKGDEDEALHAAESPPRAPKQPPTPEQLLQHNRERIAACTYTQELMSLRIIGGPRLSDEQKVELKQLREQKLAELQAKGGVGTAPSAPSEQISPERSKVTELFARLAKTDRAVAEEIRARKCSDAEKVAALQQELDRIAEEQEALREMDSRQGPETVQTHTSQPEYDWGNQ